MKPETKLRIEKEANEFAQNQIAEASVKQGYITGAEAEHTKAWNEAIDECIKAITHERSKYVTGATLVDDIIKPIMEKLESLKSK